MHWFHYEMLASGVDATKPCTHIPSERSLGIWGLTGHMTAIRGNKSVFFLGSPLVQSVQKWRSSEVESVNDVDTCLVGCGCKTSCRFHPSIVPWLLTFQVEHEQKEDLHKYTSMKVYTLAFVI